MSRREVPFFVLLSAAVCLSAVSNARGGDISHARIVRLSYTAGDVRLTTSGPSGWHKAVANTPLREGVSLVTSDGRAEVEFENGGMAWMASSTLVEFPQLMLEDGAKHTQIAVRQGTATFYLSSERHDEFAVEAGKLLITAPRSARFRVDVFSDGASVTVLHGAIEVSQNDAPQRVTSHEALALRYDEASGSRMTARPHSDAWDRWVSDRYSSLEAARMNSTDNMSAPFLYGMADLSFYGGWLSVPGYGMGWQPYGVAAGWSPFFNGFWDGFDAFGPTWISYEPWGWLPYHYGGWVNSPGFGWVWEPGGFGPWSPATVFWMRSSSGIAWVPLAPHEAPTGTPVNLAHGVVTNTTQGMLGGSGNTVLHGGDLGKLQMIGEWKGDAQLSRLSRQAQAQTATRAPAESMAIEVHGAQRMPEGRTPRLAAAGMLAGHVQVYHPPGARANMGPGFGSGAPGYHRTAGPSFPGTGGASGGAAPSHMAKGSGGSHGKP